MKFSQFREFRPGNIAEKYLSVDLVVTLRELFNGLSKLTFSENFKSYTTSITVAASGDTAVQHDLGEIPTGKILIRDGGSQDIVDGDSAWTTNYIYLKNLGASPVTVTVIIFI